MKTLFQKTNGWKTVIGLVLIGAGAIVEQFEPTTGAAIREIGKAIAEAGLIHKAIKHSQ